MRTTLDLPQPLIDEAMRLSRQKTKTALIVTALEEMVRRRRIQGIKRFRGKVALDIDLSALRGRQ
jgi:fatty acid-binding protein DegV